MTHYTNRTPVKLALALFLVLCVSMAACEDASLTKTAQALNDTALAVGAIQTVVIDANNTKVLSEDNTRAILQLCDKISDAGKQATAITRGLTKLTPAQRGSLAVILTPVLDAVTQAINTGLVPITNQDIKTRVLASLVTIQTALTTVNIILSSH